jgi:hypothetical protein
MAAGWKNCRECGHPNRHRAEAEKKQRAATARRRLLKHAGRRLPGRHPELLKMCVEAARVHGGAEELGAGLGADRQALPRGSLRRLSVSEALIKLQAEADVAEAKEDKALERLTSKVLGNLDTMSEEELDKLEAVIQVAEELFLPG